MKKERILKYPPTKESENAKRMRKAIREYYGKEEKPDSRKMRSKSAPPKSKKTKSK